MAIVYDLGNSANWQLTNSIERVAEPVITRVLERYYPIPDFEAPIQLSSPILAIYIESESDPGTWRRGGFVKQKIRTGIVGGGGNDAYLTVKPMYLRQINTYTFPLVSTAYSLEFSIPFWLRQISINVYEYTGLIADTTEQTIDEVKQLLMECCDDLKFALLGSDNEFVIQEILVRIEQLQQKLEECCSQLGTNQGAIEGTNYTAASFTNLL